MSPEEKEVLLAKPWKLKQLNHCIYSEKGTLIHTLKGTETTQKDQLLVDVTVEVEDYPTYLRVVIPLDLNLVDAAKAEVRRPR